MALTYHTGFEMGLSGECLSLAGTASISTTTPRTGTYCLRTNPTAGKGYVDIGTAGVRISFGLRAVTLPDATIELTEDGASAYLIDLYLDTTGHILVKDAAGETLRATSAGVITSTWKRISASLDTAANTVSVYFDGVVDANINGAACDATVDHFGTLRGAGGANSTCDLYFDDIAVDGASGSTDIGNICSAKVAIPTENGTTNTFDTVAGNADHHQNVDDVAGTDVTVMDDTSNYQAATAATRELYTLTQCSTIGLGASDVINGVRVMVYAAGATASGPTVRHAATNYDTNTPLGAKAWFGVFYEVNNPAGTAWTQANFNALEAGAYCGSHTTNTYLYEVMVFVAYTPAAVTGWANIAKINGVTATDVAKINGVLVADIAKVNGVAV
jgi:hypothetical protein